MNKKIAVLFSLIGLSLLVYGQQKSTIQLNWGEPIPYGLEGNYNRFAPFFEDAQYDFAVSNLPFVYLPVKVNSNDLVEDIELSNIVTAPLSEREMEIVNREEISSSLETIIENSIERKQRKAYLKLTPIYRASNGEVLKVLQFDFQPTYSKAPLKRSKSSRYATSSLMANGEWYKIGVTQKGVYKLNYQFLSSLGLDLESLDPRNLKVYGYGGGSLPEANSESRADDMLENPIVAVGDQDGSFDPGDYYLFYGDDQVEWIYDSTSQHFRHRINIYSDTTFYFIAVSPGAGKRIQTKSIPTTAPNQFVNTYDFRAYHEIDRTNLLKSGRQWMGEIFDTRLSYSFSWDVPNIDLNSQGSLEFNGVARAGVGSTFTINAGNNTFTSSASSTNLNRYEVAFGKLSRGIFDFQPTSTPVNVSVSYNKPQAVAKAWLNFINLNVRRSLVMYGNQMNFRDKNSVSPGAISEFALQSNRRPTVWDVTNADQIARINLQQIGSEYRFIDESSSLKEYIAFTATDSTNLIQLGRVQNQNLHALSQTDMVIVSNPKFLAAAEDLARHHRSEGLTVHVVTTHQVYNEFSSGAQDAVAIRSLMKMFYDRATNNDEMPDYLLLVGDASYDLKNRLNGNTNYVVSYQSPNFLQPVFSYISDDFLGLLDDNEGTWPNTSINPEKMDIAVGRLPVKTIEEANAVVEKIKVYNTANTQADWRNKIMFVGDDEDGVTHMSQSNQLARFIEIRHPDMEVEKVFLDAFQQESTSGGDRYPEVNRAISRGVQDGVLLVNYTGHGGETGWAGERILSIEDITSWDKKSNMPVFMTATCEFSRFDDPFRTSAGELVILNPNGGGVALLTTTRLVYSSPNFTLNRAFYDFVFLRNSDGNFKRLGDVFRETKNANAASSNSRNFSLLGDPALRIAIPHYQVVTTSINGKPLSQGDTLKALSKVTIAGYVADPDGNKLTDYSGTIYPTVFDKSRRVKSLNNDGAGVFEFMQRDSRIFKGRASVSQGDFSFSFIVPKDINYSFGQGKINYYTENGQTDGNGYTQSIVVGGSNDSALADQNGPQIDLYMNDESFIYGGITNANPTFLAKLFDEQGVNTVGSGLGHDLVATLDGNTEEAFILNDYYEAETDDYQRGVIRFPFEDLSPGKHTITLKAWDVANNSNEKTIEFTVVEEKDVEIENLVNYPNPFTTNTEFIFQHNQAGIPMDVKLEVFTVSGKLVKSINRTIVNQGYLSRDLRWNGRDDYGDRIGKGVYVYKLSIRSRNGSSTEKFEKLVIL